MVQKTTLAHRLERKDSSFVGRAIVLSVLVQKEEALPI